MKTRFMNLICLLACIAAGANLGLAQDVVTVLKSRYTQPQQFQSVSNIDFDKSQYQMVKSRNGNETYVKKDVLASSKKKFADEGVYVPMTLIFNMPQQVIGNISNIRLYNQDHMFSLNTWEISDNMLSTEVPQGTYQLLVQFDLDSNDPISQGCIAGMIAMEDISINPEDINIDQEVTITVNFADAKNVVYLEKKLPNGEPFDEGDYDARIGDFITQPNALSVIADLYFIDCERGLLNIYSLAFPERNHIDENGVSHDQRFRLLASDLSERYTLVMDYVALGMDEERNAYYTVEAAKTGINDSETLACSGNYKTISNSIKPSILCESSSKRGPQANIFFLNESESSYTHMYGCVDTGEANTQYYMHVCESGDALPENYKYYHNASLFEYYDQNRGKTPQFYLPWGDVSGDEVAYQVITTDRYFRYNGMPNGHINLMPNTTFSFNQSEKTGIFGNSTPINVVCYNYDQMGTKLHDPLCNYLGRMGEMRETDNYALDFSLSYNGEEVCTDYQECVNGWMRRWRNAGHADGAYDVTIVNQNMMVDDMQGCNTTKVHYDTRNQDFAPPVATMLQFRNAEDNKVTDRFEAGEDGMMYLAAKDYNIFLNENWAQCMECLPVNVKVSYAANGTDDWTEMVINEMPELFDEYSFGYIYATSLYQVMSASANKWYDLKIELSDEAGNWHEQVISPAFRIENGGSTSISEVETSSDAVVVARYSVDGRQIAAPQAGVNIVKMSDGTVRKVVVK